MSCGVKVMRGINRRGVRNAANCCVGEDSPKNREHRKGLDNPKRFRQL